MIGDSSAKILKAFQPLYVSVKISQNGATLKFQACP
jgi:hypothetical protein